MAEEAGGRANLEKWLEEQAIQQDMLERADNSVGRGNAKWADADRLAMQLLSGE